jgi:biopolymer transport protein TolR
MTRPQINVTPLIDVLLVLLIIFMVITPIKPSAFKAKVPQEPRFDGPPPNPHPDTLIVSVDSNSGLTLNKESGLGFVNDPQKMTERLRGIFEERIQNYALSSSGDAAIPRHVFIRAPRKIDYGSVAKVVDAVKQSGADPIALQIDDMN